ncbi:MAG: hypothetical protein WC408_07050 [Candidatus Micrarchaeia archaeon]|jgi:hypothetical protein
MDKAPKAAVPAIFCLSLLFVFSAVMLSHFYFGFSFITSDAYERARSAEFLIASGYPVQSTAIGADATSYPPIFDFNLAAFHLLTGLSYQQSVAAFSFFFATLFFSLAYLFARKVLSEFGKKPDDAICSLAALCVFLSPWIFYRTITPIAETLGLSLFFAAVWFFLRSEKNKLLVFAILSILSLAHFRSFSAAMICLGVLSVFLWRMKELLFESFAGILIFIYFVPRTALGFANPFVITPGIFEFFSLPLLAAAFAGLALIASKRKIPIVLAGLFAAPIALSFFAPFSFRQLPFLVLPLAAISALFFDELYSIAGSRKFRVAFFCAIALVALCLNAFVTAKQLPFDSQNAAVTKAVSAYPQDRVLAGFVQSYAIPYYSPSKKVLLGSFAEELPDFESRVYVTQKFLFSSPDFTSAQIVQLYKIDLVVSNYSDSKDPLGLGGNRLLQSDSYSAYSVP